MTTSAELRRLESELYDILDYDLPPYHQVVSVDANPRRSGGIDLIIIIRFGVYANPDREECVRICDRYVESLIRTNHIQDDIYVSVRFK